MPNRENRHVRHIGYPREAFARGQDGGRSSELGLPADKIAELRVIPTPTNMVNRFALKIYPLLGALRERRSIEKPPELLY